MEKPHVTRRRIEDALCACGIGVASVEKRGKYYGAHELDDELDERRLAVVCEQIKRELPPRTLVGSFTVKRCPFTKKRLLEVWYVPYFDITPGILRETIALCSKISFDSDAETTGDIKITIPVTYDTTQDTLLNDVVEHITTSLETFQHPVVVVVGFWYGFNLAMTMFSMSIQYRTG